MLFFDPWCKGGARVIRAQRHLVLFVAIEEFRGPLLCIYDADKYGKLLVTKVLETYGCLGIFIMDLMFIKSEP